MWFQVTHLLQKGTCFGKLTNITFAYLLTPTILQHFNQILKQVCIILGQFGPKLPILPKRYILGKLTIAFVCLLCSILQQNFQKNLGEQIIRQGFIILAQIGFDPVHQKGFFNGKVGQHCIGLPYPIMLHNFTKIL